MIGALTDLANDRKLDCFFGGSPLVPPPILYLGLSGTRANRLGVVSEPPGKSYARAVVPNDLAHFTAAANGAKCNIKPIVFPSPLEMWPSIWCVFVADAPAGGNVLAMMEIPGLCRTFYAGDPPPAIAPGAFYLSDT